MSIRYFYLKNNENKYLNVRFSGNAKEPTKNDYTIEYDDTPQSVWFAYQTSKNESVIFLKNSQVYYSAYGIEYEGLISLSYNVTTWKITDGLSTSSHSMGGDMIKYPIKHNNALHIISLYTLEDLKWHKVL